MSNPQSPSPPDWFTAAVSQAAQPHRFEVDGLSLAYRTWGQGHRPALVLVHGGCAHSHWWDFIAPYFCDSHFVLAVDLAGMGDSDHQAPYSAEQFARHLAAACDHAGVSRAVLLGHSMGGRVGLVAAARYPDLFHYLIVADARVRPPHRLQTPTATLKSRPHKVYPDLETAIARFRLLPPQPCENSWLVQYIARHSLKQVEGGWQWKFDRRIIDQDSGPQDLSAELAMVGHKMALIYGEHSVLFNPETLAYMRELTGEKAPFVKLADAQHHLFLDQPRAFVDQVMQLLVGT